MTSERHFKPEAILNIRLLVVDDEDDFREIIHKRMSRFGVNPNLAACCSDALASMEAQPADVVILDVAMPGMDGIQCLGKIKGRWPLAEVIILTGHASVKSGMDGMQRGAFDYCLKPIDVMELLEKVELAAQKTLVNREEGMA
ncbi:MAG: response regulator [Desulfobulbaceae bacterium]|jgi:DNA-binding NtrC family response regulator|nr:response regulator [Desulfobulbaceae bacterium]